MTKKHNDKHENTPITQISIEELTEAVQPAHDLAQEEAFDTQHSDGHTYNPHHAQDQGLTYTPPVDPPTLPAEQDPQGTEIATGFTTTLEAEKARRENLPPRVVDNDYELEERIQGLLRKSSETAGLNELEVHVIDGTVYLQGTVKINRDIPLIYDIVSELPNVATVKSNLRVQDR